VRRVLPFVELRAAFDMRREELDAVDRGAKDPETAPVIDAARRIAIAEDRAVFHGYPTAGIRGVCEASPEPPLRLGGQVEDYPVLIATALLEHVRRLIDGPLVWAPGLDGAAVLSQRGGDFALTVGQDFSIGYLSHDAEQVRLYIEESFTFWCIAPQAAVHIAPDSGGARQ
jgi:uncharacterized linocin/CFP29 family protein